MDECHQEVGAVFGLSTHCQQTRSSGCTGLVVIGPRYQLCIRLQRCHW